MALLDFAMSLLAWDSDRRPRPLAPSGPSPLCRWKLGLLIRSRSAAKSPSRSAIGDSLSKPSSFGQVPVSRPSALVWLFVQALTTPAFTPLQGLVSRTEVHPEIGVSW